ncbi:PLD nuclease N-terminal domain-containing protein [Gymnodinialimonas hymeniacidonis]|uniref:PLD nuclease N-terminal domain-containing protein n=1 Tax=Gymnodinialimonas hymeniacidonis TaxID=3126508 RepID=UPI0034C5FCA4
MEYGIIGLIVLIANIYALFKTWTSAASTGAKLIWTLVILILPVLGFIAWLIAGPKGGSSVNV